MRRMGWRLLFFLLALCLLGGRALAAEAPALPPELVRAAPEAAEQVSGQASDAFGLISGLETLAAEAMGEIRAYLLSGLRAVGAVMAGVVLLGALESAAPAGRDMLGRYGAAAGALWITAVAAGDLNALIGLGRETIVELSQLSKVVLPAMAAAEAASGGVTAASVRQMGAVFFSDVLLTIIERLRLPMAYLYIGAAAAGAALEGEVMERLGELLKKVIGWTLGGLLTLFTAYLTVSGALAGAADAQAVKMAQSALSAAVPVVGGILSDAAESLLAGAGLLRGMVGALGTLAVAGLCLLPLLRLFCQYALYQAASLVAAAVGPKKLVKLLSMLGDAFGLVLAMTAASALLLLISLMTAVIAAAP